MGRDNILPKPIFGKLSRRYQTPIFNILITSGVAMTALFYQDNLLGAASLISFGAITGFIMVNISVVSHYYIKGNRRHGKDLVSYLILPLIGALTLIFVFFFIDPTAKILGSVWLGVGLVYLAIRTKGFKELPPEMKLE
jgi:amino acid transporter